MKIKVEQVGQHLKRQLAPIYIVSGDEPLQQMETADLIRQTARQQNFSEREVLNVEQGFDWGALIEAGNCLSLFASRRIIELRMPSIKPGDKGSKALIEYAGNPSPDNVLIITLPKLDSASQRSKWCKALEATGVLIQVWPIDVKALPAWVSRRMKSKGLEPSQDAVAYLVEKVEGNMLAAAQEIEKLALLHQGSLNIEEVAEEVADSATFDVFGLVEAALSGRPAKIARVLDVLKASGVEPVLIQWALSREIRSMAGIANELQKGSAADQVFRKYNIWPNRAPLIRMALERLRAKHWKKLLCDAAQIDRMIKGMAPGNAWDELLKLSLAMGGTTLMRETL